MATKANTRFVIEQNQRLSQSMLWHWQRTFFEQQGVGAWRGGIVPHYITSNPYTAHAYGHVWLSARLPRHFKQR